jgi:hypothetical protein
MSGADEHERANELAKLWQGSVVPVEDEAVTDQREGRVVPALGRAIQRNFGRRGKERRVRRFVAILAAAASLGGVFGVYRAVEGHHAAPQAAVARGVGNVHSLFGELRLSRAAHSGVIQGATLELGDGLVTAAGASAEVRLTDLVVARVEGETELSVVTPEGARHRIHMERGSFEAHVDDRPSRIPKLVVETPNAELVVTGTVFKVEVSPGVGDVGAVTVLAVEKGRVVVRRDGAEVAKVSAGQRWTSERASVAVPASATTATTEVTASEPSSDANGHQRRHLQAAAHDRSGTLAEENKLFQTGAEARNRGEYREAYDRFGELLARYPTSPLGVEARVERMRALARMGRSADAAREARKYLADYPDGFAKDEARRLVLAEVPAE